LPLRWRKQYGEHQAGEDAGDIVRSHEGQAALLIHPPAPRTPSHPIQHRPPALRAVLEPDLRPRGPPPDEILESLGALQILFRSHDTTMNEGEAGDFVTVISILPDEAVGSEAYTSVNLSW